MTDGFALEGRVAVVTGATGGMGRVIAGELAGAGAHVVTIARDPRGAEALACHIASQPGPGRLTVVTGDLSLRAGVSGAARAVLDEHPAVHLLINNAGAHFGEHRLSADGVEMHIAVDYLAAYGLTSLLRGALERGRARVVTVASDTFRDTRQLSLIGPARPVTLDPDQIDDLTRLNPRGGFVPFEAYARAKLLTVIAGNGFARSLAPAGVTVTAVHPGIVATGIIDDLIPRVLRPFRSLIRRAMLTPEQGAAAALRLAVDPALAGVTGRYFVRDVETLTAAVTHDPAVQQRLARATDLFLAAGSPA